MSSISYIKDPDVPRHVAVLCNSYTEGRWLIPHLPSGHKYVVITPQSMPVGLRFSGFVDLHGLLSRKEMFDKVYPYLVND